MNTIIAPKKDNPGDRKISSNGIQESIYPFRHEINITEGSEFLDDAIRMTDQPLGKTMDRES
jgi:hypothetical protein